MGTGPNIVLVEDDSDIRELLGAFLAAEGFDVRGVGDATALDRCLEAQRPDLVILDWMLPGEDGLSICRRLRASGGPPIVMLTSKDRDGDRVLGLELGADDYVSKPFNPRVLLAHIRAVLRRAGTSAGATTPAHERVRVGDLVVDLSARSCNLESGGSEVTLTSAEFDLLTCFATRPQRVLSRDQLLDWTRGRMADPTDRTIDVQISRLRRRLEDAGSRVGTHLKTVRNAGYILAAAVDVL